MVRHTSPVELKYYAFMISLNKCTGSGNVLSPKICVPRETKDINAKAFNMITNKDEAKEVIKHISYDFKCKFNRTKCNSKQKWYNVNVKIIISVKKIIVGILAHVFLRIVSI